jgi:transposase
VIDMDLLSVIRRWHFRQGMAIREIKRRTGLSRNTIRKYLRADAVEPVFKMPDRPSKLDPFAEKLTGWLRVEAGKSRKQKRTAKQLYADLVALGYDGSYARVAAFARDWKRHRQYEQQTSGRGTFVPLVFQPGEAFQFDWSEDYAVLGGKQVKLQVAHTKLSHSRAFIVRAYLLQTHEMLFDALTQAFRVLGGVPQRGIFDNMKTAVDKIGRGKARQVNARLPRWPAIIFSRQTSAIRLQAGRRGKSRRTFRMPAIAFGNPCRAFRTWPPSMPGLRNSASPSGPTFSTACCPALSPMCMPTRCAV